MKTTALLATFALLPGSLLGADLKQDVLNAARKLAAEPNYSWRTTVVVPEDARFRPGPTEGKTEKDGWTHLTMSFFDNTSEAFRKGDKGVVTDPDGGWRLLSDLENEEGPGRFLGMIVRNVQVPADQVTNLVAHAETLTQEGEVISGELTPEGAKSFLTFRRGGEGPTVTDPQGAMKIWIKGGSISKYEIKVKGRMNFNGNEFDNDRTTTVEIKDIGKTQIKVPEEATKKLS